MTLSLPTFDQTQPSSSPAPDVDDSHPISRKRQRSSSMRSTGSSPKRSASEDPFLDSQGVDSVRDSRVQISSDLHSSVTAPDIHMSTEDDLTNPSSPPPLSSLDPSTIDTILIRPLKLGESWYIISERWLDRWRKASAGQPDKVEGVISESNLGPPDQDNHTFVDENNHLLTTALTLGIKWIPQEVWDFFISRYGGPTFPIPRKVVPRGVPMRPEVELHPFLLRVVRVVEQSTSDPGPSIPPIAVSAGDTQREMSKALATPFNMPDTPYRIWTKVEPDDWTRYPRAKLIEDRAELLEESDTALAGDLMIEPGDRFAVEFQEDGNWLVDADRIGSRSIVLSGGSGTPAPLFGPGNDPFISLQSPTGASSPGPSITNKRSVATKSWKSPAPTASSSKRAQDAGTLGLGNMGNTCFMNSALQCLAHTKELCQYFVSGVFESELNPENPLGMHGAIAQAFGALLRRIWSCTSTSTSYSPREFKQQLQRFAPQFIGYQQHDSQELVAFLLDGLHEDLNRIIKKPYVEKPDWEGGGDVELVELAVASWDGYLKRNDSVIVDLFQGQYKSTLVCPECQKVSITFDPFMYLTLPLPIQKKWWHAVYYVPWDTTKPMLRVPIETPRDATFKDLRKLLGRWMNTPADNLLTVEVFQNRFYKNLDDGTMCSETADNDIIVCFELPCRSQQSRSYKRQPDDPFIVPVYLSDAPHGKPVSYGHGTQSFFGYPMVAVIDQETAKDQDTIYSTVIERLEQWTRRAQDLYTWEGESPSSPDSMMEEVPIPITGLPPVDAVTEFKENGEVITLQPSEEGDITDENDIIIQEDETQSDAVELKRLGPKVELFALRLQNTSFPFASGFHHHINYEAWDKREKAAVPEQEDDNSMAPLLREGDTLICEFDEHIKEYYFPDLPSSDNALWQIAQDFLHPEYIESKKVDSARSTKGITLQDCLDEFTKEEKLGEDDLWYCPRCKKHQQATKRFDLWKVPDILVVHLKRFSNSRTLRDKIDTFVEFPVEGLDLEGMVGERMVTKDLMRQGVDIGGMSLEDVEEPLLYDLYAVDEHLGGLGGGHYRAYALNHTNNKWYHFDDSYVSETQAKAAVNANAYLLFYKRRTSRPLGGKTHEILKAAGVNVDVPWPDTTEANDMYMSLNPSPELPGFSALPASPDMNGKGLSGTNKLFAQIVERLDSPPSRHPWSSCSGNSSPPALDDGPSGFDDPHVDLTVASDQFHFPDPDYSKNSSTSSNEATSGNGHMYDSMALPRENWNSDPYSRGGSLMRESMDSPPGSTSEEDVNPFLDDRSASSRTTVVTEIPVDESTLNEIDL